MRRTAVVPRVGRQQPLRAPQVLLGDPVVRRSAIVLLLLFMTTWVVTQAGDDPVVTSVANGTGGHRAADILGGGPAARLGATLLRTAEASPAATPATETPKPITELTGGVPAGGTVVGPIQDSGVVLDADGDGVPDATDNCTFVPNAEQLDSDLDAIGNACDLTPFPPSPIATVPVATSPASTPPQSTPPSSTPSETQSAAPTPTPTPDPTATPEPTAVPTPTPEPTSTPLLPICLPDPSSCL